MAGDRAALLLILAMLAAPAAADALAVSPCLRLFPPEAPARTPYVGSTFELTVTMENACDEPVGVVITPVLGPRAHGPATLSADLGPREKASLAVPLWTELGRGGLQDIGLAVSAGDGAGRASWVESVVGTRNPLFEPSFIAITAFIVLGSLVLGHGNGRDRLPALLAAIGILVAVASLQSLVGASADDPAFRIGLELGLAGAVLVLWRREVARVLHGHPDVFLVVSFVSARVILFDPAGGLALGPSRIGATAATYLSDLAVVALAVALPPVLPPASAPAWEALLLGGTLYLCWWLVLARAARTMAAAAAAAAGRAMASIGVAGTGAR